MKRVKRTKADPYNELERMGTSRNDPQSHDIPAKANSRGFEPDPSSMPPPPFPRRHQSNTSSANPISSEEAHLSVEVVSQYLLEHHKRFEPVYFVLMGKLSEKVQTKIEDVVPHSVARVPDCSVHS